MSEENTFKVRFADVKSGWMTVSLKTSEQSFSFSPSYTPYDSIGELVNALYNFLWWSGSESFVRWNEKPNEYEFVFMTVDRTPGFTVYETTERVSGRARDVAFSCSGSRFQIVLPFWRALRDLETNPEHNYEIEWRRPFPFREMAALTVKVKQFQELERRLLEHAESPNEGITWDELKAQLINSK